jgi:serine/threonine-protein kinase
MPPLHGPPVDDELPGDEYPEDRPGSRRWIWLAAALVALLIVGVGGWLLLGNGTGNNGNTAQHTTTPTVTTAATGFIDTAAYVGKPADFVVNDLKSKHFTNVTTHAASGGQMQDAGVRLATGQVVTTSPASQTVPLDTPVVVYVAPRDFNPGGEATTTAAPTTTTAPPTTTAPRTTVPPTTTATTTTQTSVSLPGSSLPTTTATSSPEAAGGSTP